MNKREQATTTEGSPENEAQAISKQGDAKRQKIARSVEECLWISVGMFRIHRKGRWRKDGVLEWRGERTGRVTGVVRYRVNGIPGAEGDRNSAANFPGGPILVLAGAGHAQAIRFRSSAVTFGRRFYFVCEECERSCGKLFLPPGSGHFFCFRCHRLRYWSQRHECDFFYRPLSRSTGFPKRILRQYFYGIGDAVPRENG